jgi:hypothetical protein
MNNYANKSMFTTCRCRKQRHSLDSTGGAKVRRLMNRYASATTICKHENNA